MGLIHVKLNTKVIFMDYLIVSSQQFYEIDGITIPIFQMRKLRLTEAN